MSDLGVRAIWPTYSGMCQARRCVKRASYTICWPTASGASASDRCLGHARQFAERHGITLPAGVPQGAETAKLLRACREYDVVESEHEARASEKAAL